MDIYQSLQVQKSPSEHWSSFTVTEDRFNQMIQMTAQMQQVMIGLNKCNNSSSAALGNILRVKLTPSNLYLYSKKEV